MQQHTKSPKKYILTSIIIIIFLSIIFNEILFLKIFHLLNLEKVGFPISFIFFPLFFTPFIVEISSWLLSDAYSSFFLPLSFFWFFIAYPTLSYFYQKKKLWLRLLLPYTLIALLSFWDNYKFYLTSITLGMAGLLMGWIITKNKIYKKYFKKV